ncbi:MAG: glycosyltransferase family 2 protein [Chloroflexi bacterium]|nr:glycosyltransferase family 2 protein [Chloroflexota bacterium]
MNTLDVIILNWNTRDLLRDCLHSLGRLQAYTTVVDNASTDESAAMVEREFPAARLVHSAENLGYARANNAAMRATSAPVVVLLNSDTLVTPEAIEGIAQRFTEDVRLGALSPLLRTPDGAAQPYAFGGEPTPSYLLHRGLMRLLFRRYLHDWHPRAAIEADWVSGACLGLRRTALDAVGLLDEHMFMYFEDTELCMRLRRAGFRVRYDPSLEIMHIGGQSLKQNPAARRAYRDSLMHLYRKHYGRAALAALKIMLPVYTKF